MLWGCSGSGSCTHQAAAGAGLGRSFHIASFLVFLEVSILHIFLEVCSQGEIDVKPLLLVLPLPLCQGEERGSLQEPSPCSGAGLGAAGHCALVLVALLSSASVRKPLQRPAATSACS